LNIQKKILSVKGVLAFFRASSSPKDKEKPFLAESPNSSKIWAYDLLKRMHPETAAGLAALLPSILDKAFKGEL
jgi:hypothetical protein